MMVRVPSGPGHGGNRARTMCAFYPTWKATRGILLMALLSFLIFDGFAGSKTTLMMLSMLPNQEPKTMESSVGTGTSTNDCTANWGTFSETILFNSATTVLKGGLNKETQDEGDFDISETEAERIFIHPAYQFAFCGIPKNACSQWFTMLSKVFKNDTTSVNRVSYGIQKQSQTEYGGVEMTKKIFSNPEATRAVMVRDPLARFASAYLNKCFDRDCGSAYCPMRKKSEKGIPISFRQALDWMLSYSTNPAKLEYHWRLQSEQCGLKTNFHRYNFVLLMTKETLARDASCLMRHAGLERFDVTRPKKGDVVHRPFWVPLDNVTKRGGVYRLEDETGVLKKLFTPDYARRLVRKFQQDYDLLRIPIPDWIEDATGEWLDSTDHHQCKAIIN